MHVFLDAWAMNHVSWYTVNRVGSCLLCTENTVSHINGSTKLKVHSQISTPQSISLDPPTTPSKPLQNGQVWRQRKGSGLDFWLLKYFVFYKLKEKWSCKSTAKSDIVTHSHNSITWEVEAGGLFEANLGYTENSGPAWATEWDHVSKNKQINKNC